ncbi:HlyD family secretion protein [Vibrio mangrovi]|uniref:HlyD family secretion protein n=1 Tax=Vibrio mangrovi TaxID=474394 RepID=A0A1Y6IVM8_9VIBR|nr:HlyD family secretion protein [Vibrio mangrovi]MDW6004953.1 HlyD family secretion protein [Vibrio mangrovi]SMS01717.1 Multidrug resistance protein MdtN [Vibrio mangrovi]
MTPDQKFARWVKYSSALFIVLFAYFLLADTVMPLTPQAMATRVITKVAPRISGQITQVYVRNNQQVHKGDVLFEIDPTPYQLAVEQAKIDLEQAIQDNEQLDASITAAQADVDANQILVVQKVREAKRLDKLFTRNGVSQQQRDDALSNATATKANLMAAQARLKELQVRRGATDQENITVKMAQNRLQQAELNLSYTKVKAEHDGVITNLQLMVGTFANTGTPLIALVDTGLDIIADFREKSLRNFSRDTPALITFDRDPGHLYTATVSTIDAGVSSGQFDANGSLASPTSSNRWVRDAQRIRLHLSLNRSLPDSLPTGARATVQLIPQQPLFAWFAHMQIHALSLLHYIY